MRTPIETRVTPVNDKKLRSPISKRGGRVVGGSEYDIVTTHFAAVADEHGLLHKETAHVTQGDPLQ